MYEVCSPIGRMWSGWPTFPQVYVNGTLIGGFDDTVAALKDGTFETLLNAKDSKSEDSKSQVTLEE
jgi:glutaredoxin-related protein